MGLPQTEDLFIYPHICFAYGGSQQSNWNKLDIWDGTCRHTNLWALCNTLQWKWPQVVVISVSTLL